MRLRALTVFAFILVSAAAFTVQRSAIADTNADNWQVTVEGVNDYESLGCWGPGSNLPNSIVDADGFQQGMIGAGSIHQAGNRWMDNDVWATDFYDPDRTGFSDDDSTNFDRPGDAISYFVGHGTCLTGDTEQDCTQVGDCTNPPAGSTNLAMCRRYPGDNFGYCSYLRYARELAIGNCGGGAVNHAGRIDYSNGMVRWGESQFSGGWAAAGTLGGTNMVVLHASCAEMSWRAGEIVGAFGGIHLLATTMVHTGDTAMTTDRGANFAARYRANRNGSVAVAWADSLNSSSHRNNWCQSRAGVSFGGGFGFNGCGAHTVSALGASASEALNHQNENWWSLRSNCNDAKGLGYSSVRYTCNYDCYAWPFGI